MAAIAERTFQGQRSPLACLQRGNSRRLVSLLDIVNEFKAADFCLRSANFANLEAQFAQIRSPNQLGIWGWGELTALFIAQITHAARNCAEIGMDDAVEMFEKVSRA